MTTDGGMRTIQPQKAIKCMAVKRVKTSTMMTLGGKVIAHLLNVRSTG